MNNEKIPPPKTCIKAKVWGYFCIDQAEGKAKANKILEKSLTVNILKDKGIEATIKLAESNNSKVVVIGSGDDGLPLILGNN